MVAFKMKRLQKAGYQDQTKPRKNKELENAFKNPFNLCSRFKTDKRR